MLLLLIVYIQYSTVVCIQISSDYVQSQAEVSAAFIDFKVDENLNLQCNSEASRYLREPPFRYESLIDSRKKIMLTVKMTENNGVYENEEFIPIEHIFDNRIHDHIRLLDPYVLHMRRQPALQAYKLYDVANVSVILTDKRDDKTLVKKHANESKNSRRQFKSYRRKVNEEEKTPVHNRIRKHMPLRNCCEIYEVTSNMNRKRRHEYNVVVEDPILKPNKNTKNINSLNANEYNNDFNDYLTENEMINYEVSDRNVIKNETLYDYNFSNSKNEVTQDSNDNNDLYSLYRLEPHAELWHSVQLQLLQKTVDQSGKTLWNDLTEGDKIDIGTSNPECKRNDIAARYRLTSWLNQSLNVLPPGLSFLKKIHISDDKTSDNIIIVPSDDIVKINAEDFKDIVNLKSEYKKNDMRKVTTKNKRVIVRMNRAISISNNFEDIVLHGSNKYMTTVHKDKIESQVDVEARADNNEAIRVGSSARISTIVADGTRKTRTILTVHAANTGLAAAHFRVSVRDCEPRVLNVGHEANDVVSTKRMLISPRQTRRVQLEVSTDIPVDDVHCIVNLINDKDESVAVRDVIIKKADRCFCVWHCNCVCLGVDPQLLCNEMSKSKLSASGISSQDRPRRERCIKYPDNKFLDSVVVMIGVIIFLLLLGLIKACLGIGVRKISMWGLNRIVKLPRHIEHYHEPWLRMHRVIHDGNGWPVHPDTKKRTVRLLSWYIELILNLCFFILLPCIAIRDFILICYKKSGVNNFKNSTKNKENLIGPGKIHLKNNQEKKYEPMASPKKAKKFGQLFSRKKKEYMTTEQKSCLCKTENDDTAYILAQMKNSRNSLTVSLNNNIK